MIIFSLGFTFSLASVPGEETGIDSLEPGHLVPSGLHGDSRSRSQTVLEIEFITICFPNDILWS